MLAIAVFLMSIVFHCNASHFRGAYVSWIVNDTDPNYYPRDASSPNVKVHLSYGTSWRRSHGAPCTLSGIASCQQYNHGTWTIYSGSSTSSISNAILSFPMSYYCERFTTTYDFNIGSKVVTFIMARNLVYRIQTTSCCWVSDLAAYADSTWRVQAVIEFKTNPATGKINRPPYVDNLPAIEHYYYSTQTYVLPVYDFDGDVVRCRWASDASEGGGIWNSRRGTLDGIKCTLTLTSYMSTGWFPLAIIVEDYARTPAGNLQLQSQIPLQFTVLIHTSGAYIQGQNHTNCKAPYPRQCLSCPQGSTQAPTPSPATTPGAYLIDGCKNYQVLGNQDRLSTYYDWSSFRCDKEIYGWYRFMAGAGDRLLDYCPNRYGNFYRCGSYYQGWISSGATPSASQGVVQSSACFSMFGSCSCSYTRQIFIRNCGGFYVYWLNGVPQCNARYCGAKGYGKTVTCRRSNMRITLDSAQYNSSLYSSITLRDSSCYATISGSSILAGSTPGTCGATRSETSTHIVYENELILKAKAVNGVVRDNDQRIKFSCQYSKNGTVSLLGYKPIYNLTDSIDGFGNISAVFQMYTDASYGRVHSYYPVSAQLRDWLHLEISANVADNTIVVLLDECFSTPTMDRNYPQKSTFIKNGCQSGQEFVTFYPSANNKNRFSVQAIRFLQNSTAVFFHCRFYLCYATSTDPKCNMGCGYNRRDKNLRRGKRSIEEHAPSGYYSLEMEVRLKEETHVPGKKIDQSIDPVYIGIFGAGIFLLIAVVAALLVKMRRLKRSHQREEGVKDHKNGEAIGVDNKGLQLSSLS